jgi:hypothetical protein
MEYIFTPSNNEADDPISLKKLKKGDSMFALQKDVLGFVFKGAPGHKMIELETPKREFHLAILKKWLKAAGDKQAGIVFQEFESIISKVWHAFTAIPSGKGLFTPFNKLLRLWPPLVNLHRTRALSEAIRDFRTLLWESSKEPTHCSELIIGIPHFVCIKDASIHDVGGIIVGHIKPCVPTVFRMEWPPDIRAEVLKTNARQSGNLTNPDLEMAGLLLLFLIMENMCDLGPGCHVALCSDNAPTVNWAWCMASKGSRVSGQLLRALTLRLKATHVSPLTPLQIAGTSNALTDIPSRSFGSASQWYCRMDHDLLTLFNHVYPLPSQNLWTVLQPSSAIRTRVISVLRMQAISMEEWRQPPKPGQHTGTIGRPMSHLWEWTLTWRVSPLNAEYDASQGLQHASDKEDLAKEEQ